MLTSLRSAPNGFFRYKRPYPNSELLRFVRKAAELGFKAFQVGSLSEFRDIDCRELKKLLDTYDLGRNVHIGGSYDAKRFASVEAEFERVRMEIRSGIELCQEISSNLASFHPPIFSESPVDAEISDKAKSRLMELLRDELDFALSNEVRLALESFCYRPFIFDGLTDFVEFLSGFSHRDLDVLIDVGHLHQAGINPEQVVKRFKRRIFDVHIHDATSQTELRKATHLPIGKGEIDFHSLIRNLWNVGYSGWLTLEIHGEEKDIIRSKKLLDGLIDKRG